MSFHLARSSSTHPVQREYPFFQVKLKSIFLTHFPLLLEITHPHVTNRDGGWVDRENPVWLFASTAHFRRRAKITESETNALSHLWNSLLDGTDASKMLLWPEKRKTFWESELSGKNDIFEVWIFMRMPCRNVTPNFKLNQMIEGLSLKLFVGEICFHWRNELTKTFF